MTKYLPVAIFWLASFALTLVVEPIMDALHQTAHDVPSLYFAAFGISVLALAALRLPLAALLALTLFYLSEAFGTSPHREQLTLFESIAGAVVFLAPVLIGALIGLGRRMFRKKRNA